MRYIAIWHLLWYVWLSAVILVPYFCRHLIGAVLGQICKFRGVFHTAAGTGRSSNCRNSGFCITEQVAGIDSPAIVRYPQMGAEIPRRDLLCVHEQMRGSWYTKSAWIHLEARKSLNILHVISCLACKVPELDDANMASYTEVIMSRCVQCSWALRKLNAIAVSCMNAQVSMVHLQSITKKKQCHFAKLSSAIDGVTDPYQLI